MRVSRFAVAASIVLVLVAMILPVCHHHPLLDTSSPDHCTICVSLHAAVPVAFHLPVASEPLLPSERVVVVKVGTRSSFIPRFAASRAPPFFAC